MNTFHLRILAAENTFFEGECENLIVPCPDGSFGVQAHHINMISAVSPGELHYRPAEGPDAGVEKIAAVSAGLVKVENNDVLVLVDTAGRLHNKQNLMNELNKISRIVNRELPEASREVLLVLDGTTGQNGLIQAKQFKEIAGVTAIALTKLDGTAKGGIVIAVAHDLQIPVKFVGVGEKADDLMPFEARAFVDALL